MTEISIRKTSLGRSISVKGHARRCEGDKSEGNIICAAVSMLVQTIAKILCDAEDEGNADIIDITLKSGEAEISYITDDETVNTQVEAIAKGFELLCDSHPEIVSLETL